MKIVVDIECERCDAKVKAVLRVHGDGRVSILGYSRKDLKRQGWTEDIFDDWRCPECSKEEGKD